MIARYYDFWEKPEIGIREKAIRRLHARYRMRSSAERAVSSLGRLGISMQTAAAGFERLSKVLSQYEDFR